MAYLTENLRRWVPLRDNIRYNTLGLVELATLARNQKRIQYFVGNDLRKDVVRSLIHRK